MAERRNSGPKLAVKKNQKNTQGHVPWMCLKCDDAIDHGQGNITIQRFLCKEFCHKSCSGLTNAQFNCCRGASSIQWTCEGCGEKEVIVKSQIEAKLDGIFQLLQTMTTRLEHLEMRHDQEEHIEQIIEKKVEEYLRESEEKEKRKLNIIVVNLPESKKETSEVRKMEDIDRVRALISQIPEVRAEEAKNPLRLGPMRIGQNVKPRMLRMEVGSEETKIKILKGIFQLNKSKPPMERIFINSDSTPKEREKIKQLRAEMSVRIEGGEIDLRIDYRKFEIVKRQVRPDQRQGAAAPLTQGN